MVQQAGDSTLAMDQGRAASRPGAGVARCSAVAPGVKKKPLSSQAKMSDHGAVSEMIRRQDDPGLDPANVARRAARRQVVNQISPCRKGGVTVAPSPNDLADMCCDAEC